VMPWQSNNEVQGIQQSAARLSDISLKVVCLNMNLSNEHNRTRNLWNQNMYRVGQKLDCFRSF